MNYIELLCPITIACHKVWKTNIEHENLSQEKTNKLVQTKKTLNPQFEQTLSVWTRDHKKHLLYLLQNKNHFLLKTLKMQTKNYFW
jgi:hypothetical protein